jgi:hypothetical protein
MLGDTTGPGQPANPDPHQDRSGEAMPQPGRFGLLLGLVRKLVDYGKELVSTLQNGTPTEHLPIRIRFGAADIALILRRIACGLRRAAAFEYRLIDCAEREAKAKPSAHSARPPPARPPRGPRPQRPQPDPSLADRLPTAEEIADQVRRRPIGAVLADICEDLGIVPAHPLWREMHMALTSHGGNYLALFNRTCERISAGVHANRDELLRLPLPLGWPPHLPPPDWFPHPPMIPAEPATGPP